MSVILILILASLGMALLFLGGFIWAVRSGQFEDTLTPSLRVLTEESKVPGVDRPGSVDESTSVRRRTSGTPHRTPPPKRI